MKALLSVAGVLGLAVVFSLSEPVPASTRPVTSDDVSLMSEQMLDDAGVQGFGRNARGSRYGGGGTGGSGRKGDAVR